MIQLNPKNLDDSEEINGLSPSDESADEKGSDEDTERKPQIPMCKFSMEGRLKTEEIESTVSNVIRTIKRSSLQPGKAPSSLLKSIVSKDKQRYNMDGFNLDLTYINDRIIALGFPAENMESVYRNSMADVKAFFNLRHPNRHMIINLCSEKKYKHTHFNGMVKEFPFDDHQAPPFRLIIEACQFIDQWLKAHPDNVVGVHCKAGKGRTGVIVSCYLIYNEWFKTAQDALKYYGMIRTKNGKGVTIPSQIRYVQYFEQAIKSQWKPTTFPRHQVELATLTLSTSPRISIMGGCEPFLVVSNGDREWNSKDHLPIVPYKPGQQVRFKDIDFLVEEDVLVQVFNDSVLKSEKILQFWFHTTFIKQNEETVIPKEMLDVAVRDKEHKRFPVNFSASILPKTPSQVRRRSQPVLFQTKS